MADEELAVLLVEDSPSDAFLLQEYLSSGRIRFDVRHAETLKDGLEILRNGGVDVVLLDLSLPDARGIETVIRTHAAAQDAVIIVLTGLDDEATAIQALQEGAQDYLVKDQIDRNLLIKAIRYARERKRTEEATRRLAREQVARANAEAAEHRARFLVAAGRSLAASLDSDTTVYTVAKLVVPTVADCCLVDLLYESGQVFRVGAFSIDGTVPELWREGPTYSSELAANPVVQALRTGRIIELDEVPEATARALGVLERCGKTPPRSALVVPMLARGHTLGALTFITCNPERRGGQELPMAQELAAMAALALDNARLYRAREQLLEVVSHDLRTPLTTMMGNVSLIQDMKAPPQAPLEIIFRAAGHMSRLVEDLLDLSRLEGGTFVLEREAVDLAALLDEVVQMMRSAAEIRGLKLQATAPAGLPKAHADRRRVMQVLWNLVGNALKFTPAGGTVEIRAMAAGQDLRVEVADTGPGLPEKQLPHVFERFWQGGASNQQGVGLGLSIAKSMVEAHGGKIGVGNAHPGPGAVFFFTLSRAPEK